MKRRSIVLLFALGAWGWGVGNDTLASTAGASLDVSTRFREAPARLNSSSVNIVPLPQAPTFLSLAQAEDAEPSLAEDDLQSVESVKESLDGWGAPPWYDATKDAEKPIRVKARSTSNVDWWAIFKPIIWGAALLLIGLLIYVLLRAFFDRRKQPMLTGPGFRGQKALRAEIGRIESLPFQLDKKPTSLLEEAERLYREGNPSQAILYLFSYQLVEMDKLQMIRLTRGKTNRQYLRELKNHARLRGLMEPTVVAFEHVFFGKHSLPAAAFEACWRRVGEFERLIREGAPAA